MLRSPRHGKMPAGNLGWGPRTRTPTLGYTGFVNVYSPLCLQGNMGWGGPSKVQVRASLVAQC